MAAKARILVVDDEPPIGDIVSTALGKVGYEVHYAMDAEQAIAVFQREPIDLFILDIMMPRMDGFTLCEWIRRRSNLPVIMLTAKGSVNDIVHGLKVGADDYITKPFTVKELEARVGAVLRRTFWGEETAGAKAITIAEIHIDSEARLVTARGDKVRLSPTEFELLHYMMSRAGQVINRTALFRDVWGYDSVEDSNLVEVGIRRLREKIEADPSKPRYILTVRGVGYQFADQPAEDPDADGGANGASK
jgi:two-component system, OmpR family, response regulator MtrA